MNRHLSWDLIASAGAVFQTGSLSAAARSLGVTQPTIRRHLDELEAALGVTLFTRSPTGLLPTDAANDIAPYAQDIQSLVTAMVRIASAERSSVSGTIRVSCSEIMGNEVLPILLAPFLERHPAIQIELIASNRTDDLLRRDADVAVRMVRPVQTGLVGKKVARLQLGLFASAAYLDRRGSPETLADLITDHVMIGEDRGTTMVEALGRLAPDAQSIEFQYRSDSDCAQLAAIRAGIGIGICQVPLARADLRLRRVLPHIATSLDVWLVTHEDLRDQIRIRALLDHLAVAIAAFAKGSVQSCD